MADGLVNVIAFDAIANRLGPRWPGRRELVHEHAERTLQRHLAGVGSFLRISETDYVVIYAGSDRTTAQVLCINAMRETLTHFLGEALIGDLVVHEVTRVSAEGVFGERVDAAAVQAMELLPPAVSHPGARGSIDQWTPFVASDGRSVRVSCQLEPVFQLKTSERIGRMARRILACRPRPLTPNSNLARADIERVDFAMARGLDRLRLPRWRPATDAHLPVSTPSSARAPVSWSSSGPRRHLSARVDWRGLRIDGVTERCRALSRRSALLSVLGWTNHRRLGRQSAVTGQRCCRASRSVPLARRLRPKFIGWTQADQASRESDR